jgi:hypothetical protein
MRASSAAPMTPMLGTADAVTMPVNVAHLPGRSSDLGACEHEGEAEADKREYGCRAEARPGPGRSSACGVLRSELAVGRPSGRYTRPAVGR